jgi:hypothetical protein
MDDKVHPFIRPSLKDKEMRNLLFRYPREWASPER